MRGRLQVACVLLLACTLGGCSVGDDEGGGGDGELKVYVSVPTRGPAGTYGRAIGEGAKLALRDVDGRVAEVEVDAVILDDTDGHGARARWSPGAVAENARAATSDSTAIAYIGEFESGATRASVPITNEARVLQVSPASTALDLVSAAPGNDEVPELVQPSGERTFGRVIPDDEAQAGAGAAWARKLGARAALVIDDGSEFGDTIADEFEEEAVALGISVDRRQGGLDSLITERPNFDLVYYAGPVARTFPLLARAAQASDAVIMGTDALLLDRAFLRLTRSLGSPFRLTASAQDPAQLPSPRGPEFESRYREEYGRDPDPYAAYGYEAMAVVLDAIERVGEPVDRGAVIDAFFETADRNSVLGTYSIDEVGNTTLDRIAGYRVRDGRPVFDASLRAP